MCPQRYHGGETDARRQPETVICQVVLLIFKRTPHQPCPVGHGDVEVVALCAVHLLKMISKHKKCGHEIKFLGHCQVQVQCNCVDLLSAMVRIVVLYSPRGI